ncbi:hypothetical protein A8C56_14135 [Niabella ginsenosidivorans]|uniref:Uncharacterized protein n=1 Tax=Niabella ginsenosidivorans TaxID=1176587 RepID=A0A1A9I5Y3_9BACT|nr:hypothetical protein [Niabella ginsenosidivorans]ANH81954.1 hypothetical protein A8C56_14135 [Niabella ginsenosidivorans]
MKKIIAYSLALLLSCIRLNAQKNIDLIISIDEKIVSSISGLNFIAVTLNGEERIQADYYPGHLSLSDSDYNKLLDTVTRTVYISFDYTEQQNTKQHLYHYQIDLKKGWLKHYYYILSIYNMTKRKYRDMFSTAMPYVYEFEYPGGATKLVRKKSKAR